MGPERIAEWLDRLGPGLVLFARQWSANPEDAVQEAFVALAGQAREPDDPAAWLYRAARNAAINAGVAEARRRRREAEAAGAGPRWFEPPDAGSAGAVDPDSAREALAALPDDERAVIVAHLWGGLRFDQVAALLGTSSSTAHRRYRSGLARLRDRLGAVPS